MKQVRRKWLQFKFNFSIPQTDLIESIAQNYLTNRFTDTVYEGRARVCKELIPKWSNRITEETK